VAAPTTLLATPVAAISSAIEKVTALTQLLMAGFPSNPAPVNKINV
jgi:hypothetical protein